MMRAVSVAGGSGDQAGPAQAGLLLLFDRGARPDRAAVATALAAIPRAAISHDPATVAGPRHIADPASPMVADAGWLELLLDGLTFDLLGLAPGPALERPDIAHRYQCDIDDSSAGEAIGLFPGPHIAPGAASLPILRALVGLGAGLVEALPGVRCVCWAPARSAIAPQFFAGTVETWLAGGPFPALGLLGLWFDETGTLCSEGLNFLSGYELAIDAALTEDRVAAMRLAVRIVHELVGAEPSNVRHEFVTEMGGRLALEPDPSAGLIRIRPL